MYVINIKVNWIVIFFAFKTYSKENLGFSNREANTGLVWIWTVFEAAKWNAEHIPPAKKNGLNLCNNFIGEIIVNCLLHLYFI